MMNPMQLLNSFRQFMANPQQFLSQLNIPANAVNNPKSAVEYLMNNGQMTQQQFNQLANTVNQMRNNPVFSSMFNTY